MSQPTKPVTRIASFKFLPTTTAAQISDRARSFLALYAKHPDLLLAQPRGGKSLRTPLEFDGTGVQGELEWDLAFVAVFKSDEARREFDADPGHMTIKAETDPLLKKVFVYDFAEEENLGW